jgi:AhpC/TSA family
VFSDAWRSIGFDADDAPAVFFKLPCLKLFDHDKIVIRAAMASLAETLSPEQARFILEERMAALQAGEMAPEFELPAVTGKQRHKVKLSDFRGKKNVIVAFYPLDWSPT